MHPAEETLLKELEQAPNRALAVNAAADVTPKRAIAGRFHAGYSLLRATAKALCGSTWLPIVSRAGVILGCMLGFAIVGVGATLIQTPQAPIASQTSKGAAVMWLAPTPPPLGTEPPASTPPPVGSSQSPPTTKVSPQRTQHGCSPSGDLCSNDPKPASPKGVTSDGKVILNIAGADVLTRLPGVGAKRAEAIVTLRERLKRFRRTTDLLRVRGIGVKSLKRMLPHLVLDPPKAEGGEDSKLADSG